MPTKRGDRDKSSDSSYLPANTQQLGKYGMDEKENQINGTQTLLMGPLLNMASCATQRRG